MFVILPPPPVGTKNSRRILGIDVAASIQAIPHGILAISITLVESNSAKGIYKMFKNTYILAGGRGNALIGKFRLVMVKRSLKKRLIGADDIGGRFAFGEIPSVLIVVGTEDVPGHILRGLSLPPANDKLGLSDSDGLCDVKSRVG